MDRRVIRRLPEDYLLPGSSTFLPQKNQQLCSGKSGATHDLAMPSAVRQSWPLVGMHVQPMGTESAQWIGLRGW
jgi:hypothetical protein